MCSDDVGVMIVSHTRCYIGLSGVYLILSQGGVLLLGYDMYRNLTTSFLKRTRKPSLKRLIPEALIDPGPDIVVCDEGHLLKNYNAGITKAVCSMKTPKRVVLTGTPLQNNLPECTFFFHYSKMVCMLFIWYLP